MNDIDTGILSKISKFEDDTKLCKCVVTEEDAFIMREDLSRLYEWTQGLEDAIQRGQMFCNAHGKRQQEVPMQHRRSNFDSIRGRIFQLKSESMLTIAIRINRIRIQV